MLKVCFNKLTLLLTYLQPAKNLGLKGFFWLPHLVLEGRFTTFCSHADWRQYPWAANYTFSTVIKVVLFFRLFLSLSVSFHGCWPGKWLGCRTFMFIAVYVLVYFCLIIIYRVAQKSKPLPIFQKIALKIANEIRFLRKVKVWIKHYNTIRW